jgi:hypothetical protein
LRCPNQRKEAYTPCNALFDSRTGTKSRDQGNVDAKTLFLPGNLPDGMESADPMIGVRNAAYPLSYRHRQ